MWSDFEHRVWRKLTEQGFDQQNPAYILALSGGVDSMALAQVFLNLRPNSRVVWAHFHHGPGQNQNYRDEALEFLKSKYKDLRQTYQKLEFHWEKSEIHLSSEQEFREARLSFFKKIKDKICDQTHAAIVATGHHSDDLLETWLIKMVRGAGPESLAHFQEWNGETFRPFLSFSKSELQQYLESKKERWVEDPSNQDIDYLRNWIRQKWLPQLEEHHRGGVYNLGQSLSKMVQSLRGAEDYRQEIEVSQNESLSQVTFSRMWFFSLTTKDQMRVVAYVLRLEPQRPFTQGHLEEILKRLDKNQKELTFHLFGINWFINAEQVMLQWNKQLGL